MSKEECMEALSKHAHIKPLITSTVWNELEKENKDFFEAYRKGRDERAIEIERRRMIQKRLNAISKERTEQETTSHEEIAQHNNSWEA
ncbi:hypothetical protein V6N12_027125 [Hibiscus sabdariffa]|uniref:Uncharacterized protein n=1 Tax=Hibiscus sabdariffa TaxID=183260 RepID=A0ABR2DTT7_9ROSI